MLGKHPEHSKKKHNISPLNLNSCTIYVHLCVHVNVCMCTLAYIQGWSTYLALSQTHPDWKFENLLEFWLLNTLSIPLQNLPHSEFNVYKEPLKQKQKKKKSTRYEGIWSITLIFQI